MTIFHKDLTVKMNTEVAPWSEVRSIISFEKIPELLESPQQRLPHIQAKREAYNIGGDVVSGKPPHSIISTKKIDIIILLFLCT